MVAPLLVMARDCAAQAVVAFDPGRATAARLTVPHILPSSETPGPCDI